MSTASYDPQQRVFADRQHEPSRKGRRRSSAQCQAKVVDDAIQPCRASCRWRQSAISEALGEDLSSAQDGIAAKTPSNHNELGGSTGYRQIGNAALVATMDASRNRPARRAHAEVPDRTDCDNGLIDIAERTLNNKPRRHKGGWAQCLLHGADSPENSSTRISNFIKSESEPKLHAD